MIRLDEQYPALNGGVAERPRAQQDMGELLSGSNVWYDPSRGLTRRPAMRLVSQLTNGTYNNAVESTYTWGDSTLTAAEYAAGLGGTVRSTFELAYEFRGEQYAVFAQKEALGPNDAPVYAVRKSDGRRIVSPIPGTGVAAALANGVNAAAVVGDLLVLAPRAAARHESHPTYTVARPWAVQANQQNLAAWVRGGAFARPYKLTLVRGDSRMWVQYTTLSEAYPAKLDTSDIPTTDPEYSKKVNDRTNAYNSAATAWLAAALADITPENIATRLAAAVNASGYLAPASTAVAVGSSVLITDPSIEELFVEDGGDGSLIMAAGNTIPSAASVVAFHLPGKILKILPNSEGGANSFYLKAVAKDQSTGAMTQVSWEECAGEELVAAAYFVYGAIAPAADPVTYPEGRLYLERSISALNAAAGTAFPEQLANVSGDMETNPPPAFYSKEVSAMAAFQDRLVVVCAGGAVSTSQPGDYLNFFRTSMLTTLPRDPVAFTIIGGEGDTVRHAVKYDRNLLLVGTQQYMIPGRNALVPGQAAASIYSSVPGMDTVEPVVQSGWVYFARYHGGRTSVHAMTAGRVVEDPQIVDLTIQAPNLITAPPVRLLATATPEAVLLLTADPRYSYLVQPDMRKGELRGGVVWPWALSVPEDVVPTLPGTTEQTITFSEVSLGTQSPVIGNTSFGRGFTGNSQGNITTCDFLTSVCVLGSPSNPLTLDTTLGGTQAQVVTDGAAEDTRSICGSSDFGEGLSVAMRFASLVRTVTLRVGGLNDGNVRVRMFGADGSLLSDQTSSPATGFWAPTYTAASNLIAGVLVSEVGVDDAGWGVDRVFTSRDEGSGGPAVAAKFWSAVGVYEHRGVVNYLWQARTLTGSASPWNVAKAYHLSSLDFRARTAYAGWWALQLGTLPFTGYADFDTFSVVPSPWTGVYEALAVPVPPTRYTDKGFSVPIPSTDLGAMRQARPLTLVSYRVHYADTSYAKAVVGSAVWWQQAAVNPSATPVTDGGWSFRQDSGTPATEPAVTAVADFLSPVPVGRLVHQAGVTLRSVGKHPFTISGVQWTGALHTRSDRG